jgi:hypothetical protein
VDGQTARQTNDGWVDGWTEGWMNDEQKDGRTHDRADELTVI